MMESGAGSVDSGPPDQSILPPISRRRFLQLSGAGVGLAAGALTLRTTAGRAAAQAMTAVGNGPIAYKTVPSVCANCPAGCGILVKTVNGRAVKIEGNPKHPVNRGVLCPKGQAGLQVLYDPDRIRGPLKRAGKRGEGKWVQISWDQAIDELAAKLAGLRAAGKAHTVVSLSGRRLGQMTALVENFMKAYGSPNALRRGASCAVAGEKGYWMLDGQDHHRGHDWENANYILLFGYPFAEASRPLTYNIRGVATGRRGRPVRSKVVLVDPRYGTSAAKADEWVPITPGTDGAMALAMAHVILTRGLWERGFVGDFAEAGQAFKAGETVDPADFKEVQTLGLVKWWNLVVKDATPQWQEAITGVPAGTVERIAVEVATTRPALVDAGDKGTSSQSNGMYTRAAIHSLNGLLGSIEAPGGILTQKSISLKALPAPVQDDVAKAGTKKPRIDKAKSKKWPLAGNVYGYVPQAILDGYAVNVILGYYTAPFFCWPDPQKFRDAFAKVEMLVSFSPFMDEYTSHCDLVLPDHTYLERYQYNGAGESAGYAVLGLRRPVVKPLFDTMDTGDVFIRLAKKLGGGVAETLPFEDNGALIRHQLSGLSEADRAALDRDGVIAKPPYKYRDYAGNFKTPSKKFEFDSGNLRKAFTDLKMTPEDIAALGITATGDAVYLPYYEPVRYSGGPEARYPLLLNTYKLTVRGEGRTANAPFLSELMSPVHNIKWDSWAEMNPATAASLGIADGDRIAVESAIGKIETRARVFPGAHPKTVSIPHHLGHRGYGRWSRGLGANPNEIIPQDHDFANGQAAFPTRVKVHRIAGPATAVSRHA